MVGLEISKHEKCARHRVPKSNIKSDPLNLSEDAFEEEDEG